MTEKARNKAILDAFTRISNGEARSPWQLIREGGRTYVKMPKKVDIDSIKITKRDENKLQELLKKGRELQAALRKKVAPLQKISAHQRNKILDNPSRPG